MTDYFGFTMASLNENGSVFANPCKGEKNMSTLMYRPFSSWANSSEVRNLPFQYYVLLYFHSVICKCMYLCFPACLLRINSHIMLAFDKYSNSVVYAI